MYPTAYPPAKGLSTAWVCTVLTKENRCPSGPSQIELKAFQTERVPYYRREMVTTLGRLSRCELSLVCGHLFHEIVRTAESLRVEHQR